MVLFYGFVRRVNRDSTIDSICTRCFRTIATDKDEIPLVNAEKTHTCGHLKEVNQQYRPTWDIYEGSGNGQSLPQRARRPWDDVESDGPSGR